jgi:putative Holliday junction resolvase
VNPDDSGPGRLLALDLGDVRIGVAVSDPLGITAQPLPHLEAGKLGTRRLAARVAEEARRHEVVGVVIGLPRLLSGEEGVRAQKSREFAAALETQLSGVTVYLWDERLSTVEVERAMIAGNVSRRKRRQKIDSLAAVLILQGFLDARCAAGSVGSDL